MVSQCTIDKITPLKEPAQTGRKARKVLQKRSGKNSVIYPSEGVNS